MDSQHIRTNKTAPILDARGLGWWRAGRRVGKALDKECPREILVLSDDDGITEKIVELARGKHYMAEVKKREGWNDIALSRKSDIE